MLIFQLNYYREHVSLKNKTPELKVFNMTTIKKLISNFMQDAAPSELQFQLGFPIGFRFNPTQVVLTIQLRRVITVIPRTK